MTTAALASTPEREPWRAGAGVLHVGEASPPARKLTPELEALLDGLDEPASAVAANDDITFDDSPLKPKKPPAACSSAVDSIARLIAAKQAGRDLASFEAKKLALAGYDTATLILRIHTAQDPLMLWEIHLELDKRGIAPALRQPENTDTPQGQFISWLADLFWFTKRNPGHAPKAKGWRMLLTATPGSPAWLEKGYQLFVRINGRSLAHIAAKSLALSDTQRQDLLTLPTRAMVKARQQLQTEKFSAVQQCLLTDARANRDRSGRRTPEEIARTRAALWRVHILLGSHPTETVKNWNMLIDKPVTRQAVSQMLTTTAGVLETLHKFE